MIGNINEPKAQHLLLFISIFLIVATRPRFDAFGVTLNPSYLVLLLVPLIKFSRITIYRHEWCLIVFYFYSSCTIFYSWNFDRSLRFCFGAAFILVLFFVVKALCSRITTADFKQLVMRLGKAYFVISAVLYIFGTLYFGDSSERGVHAGVFVSDGFVRMTGVAFDPNFFAAYLIPFLFVFLMEKKLKWFNFGVVFLLLSFSRAGWLAAILGFLVSFFIIKDNRYLIRVVISVLGIMVVFWFFYETNMLSSKLALNSRLNDITDGSGRLVMWKNGIDLFLQKPITGWGIFTFRLMNFDFFGVDKFIHNTYLEVFVETGILGGLLFFLMMAMMFYRIIMICKNNRDCLFLLPTFLGFAVTISFLSLYINTLFLFFLIFFGFNGATPTPNQSGNKVSADNKDILSC